MFSYSWIVSSDIQKKPLHFKKSLVIHAKVCLSTRDSVVHGYSCFSGRPGSLMSPACPSSVYLTPGSVLRGHGLPLFHEHKAAMTTCSCRINPFFRLSAALIQKLKGQIIPTGYTCAQLRRLVLLVSLVTSRLYMLKKKKTPFDVLVALIGVHLWEILLDMIWTEPNPKVSLWQQHDCSIRLLIPKKSIYLFSECIPWRLECQVPCHNFLNVKQWINIIRKNYKCQCSSAVIIQLSRVVTALIWQCCAVGCAAPHLLLLFLGTAMKSDSALQPTGGFRCPELWCALFMPLYYIIN